MKNAKHRKKTPDRPWTHREIEWMKQMRADDVKMVVIAKRLGRTFGSLKSKLDALNLMKRHPYKKVELHRRIANLIRYGKNDHEIAEILGIFREVVSKYRNRTGKPPNITFAEAGRLAGIASGVIRRARAKRGDTGVLLSVGRESPTGVRAGG